MSQNYRIPRGTWALAVMLAVASCATRDEPATAEADQATLSMSSLEGTWRPLEDVITRGDSTVTQESEPTLYLFTPTHYAIMGTLGGARTLYQALDPTEAEKLSAFNTFWGNMGTYEVAGDLLTFRPVFARNPNLMAGGYRVARFRVAGDTLWLNQKSTDSYFRLGDEVVPDPRSPSQYDVRMMRVR